MRAGISGCVELLCIARSRPRGEPRIVKGADCPLEEVDHVAFHKEREHVNEQVTSLVAECGSRAGCLCRRSAAPVNDDCENAIEITSLPFTDTCDTTTATNPSTDPTDCDGEHPRSVWYRFTPVQSNLYIFSLCGSNYDTMLGITRHVRRI